MEILKRQPDLFRLLQHAVRLAASRDAWTAGNKIAIRMPIIAMTTSNSTSVNARDRDEGTQP